MAPTPEVKPNLFAPIKVGDVELQHRIVMAPLTRFRADKDHVPSHPTVKEYYRQRTHTPGTLIITEATFIAAKAGGYTNIPGIWSEAQIAAWKEITDAIHAAGSYIYLQLWALGRAADPEALKSEDPSYSYVSASPIPLSESKVAPRALTKEEIKEYVSLYATAASNAVHRAGFDGVEVHGAHGYLLDQFIQDVSNQRTDEYGGSPENRSRFPLEVVDAVVKAVGETKTAIRLSPWSRFQDMGMANPVPTFSYLVSQLRQHHPNLAYIHVVEPRVSGLTTRNVEEIGGHESNDFIRHIWAPRPLITAGAYTRETAIKVAQENEGELTAFGRHFISNPDLVKRLEYDVPLTPYDRNTFYSPGDVTGVGYTDYPFADFTAVHL